MVSDLRAPPLRQEEKPGARSLRDVGVGATEPTSNRSRQSPPWPVPAAAILGVLPAASFVTRPRGQRGRARAGADG